MAQVVEYQIKGTSDVPQQTAKAKTAMSELERQTQAVTKKFSEFGKDFILGFFAPMVLLQSAINFVTASIERRRKDIADALAFAEKAEAKLFASQQEIEAARQARERKEEEENKKKAEELKLQARIEFFKTTPEGRAMAMAAGRESVSSVVNLEGTNAFSEAGIERYAEQLARSNEKLSPELQAAFDKFFGAAAEQRAAKKTEEDAAKAGAKAAVFAGDNSVFGIGNSPQMNILNAQVELQKQANEYLAVIAASAGGQADFTKDQTGGMASQVNYKDYTKTV
jgi:hypothetical protein